MKISLFRLMPMFLLCCAYDAAIASGVDCAAAAGAFSAAAEAFLASLAAGAAFAAGSAAKAGLASNTDDSNVAIRKTPCRLRLEMIPTRASLRFTRH